MEFNQRKIGWFSYFRFMFQMLVYNVLYLQLIIWVKRIISVDRVVVATLRNRIKNILKQENIIVYQSNGIVVLIKWLYLHAVIWKHYVPCVVSETLWITCICYKNNLRVKSAPSIESNINYKQYVSKVAHMSKLNKNELLKSSYSENL